MLAHLMTLSGSSTLWLVPLWAVARLIAKFDLVRLIVSRQALKAARQKDIPAVTEALSAWKSPRRWKFR